MDTPLYNACHHGREAIITMLMQAGADPDMSCGRSRTDGNIKTARKLEGYKRWAEKNPSLDPPAKTSTPKAGGGSRDSSQHPDEGDQENTPSSTPA
ncbi:hypothetical protein K440DRAFT_611196 [Wilcoxina mikolae CBS 423.85]|nr:hypothetical protein K440DRAFT_611196 [Wilcoxina mikolae CBS 423.85]